MTGVELAAIIGISSSLGYALPAIIGLESMGVPSPGEVALVTAATLAHSGRLQIWLVLLIGAASAIVGDNIGYWLGRELGKEVLTRDGPFVEHRRTAIAAAERFFDRHGNKAVFLGRWVALVRVSAAWVAGISRMPFREFFLWNALGGITWTVTVGLLGYYFGHVVENVISKIGVGAAIALGVLAVIAFVVWRLRRRRGGRGGRAAVEPGAGERPTASAADPAPPS